MHHLLYTNMLTLTTRLPYNRTYADASAATYVCAYAAYQAHRTRPIGESDGSKRASRRRQRSINQKTTHRGSRASIMSRQQCLHTKTPKRAHCMQHAHTMQTQHTRAGISSVRAVTMQGSRRGAHQPHEPSPIIDSHGSSRSHAVGYPCRMW